jgi:hypothetical protein
VCHVVNNRFGATGANQLYLQVDAVMDDGTTPALSVTGDFRYCVVEWTK